MEAPTSAVAQITERAAPRGPLVVLTSVALAASAVPLPFLPDRVIARIRGAIAHDVLARAGLSLTTDARAILAATDTTGGRAILRKAADLLTTSVLKRLGPVGIVTTALRAAEVYAFGYLLERYVRRVRRIKAVRVHDAEARRVREAIDRAVMRAFSPSLRTEATTLETGVEDLRDEFTRWIDLLLLAGASLPSHLDRRLDAAFDDVISQMVGIGDEP